MNREPHLLPWRLARFGLLCAVTLQVSAVSVFAQEFELPTPPTHPTVIFPLPDAVSSKNAATAAGTINWYDTSNRETVRNLFNTVWTPNRSGTIAWTGNVAGCQAGAISQSWNNSVATSLNFLRNLAGVNGTITLNSLSGSKDQEASLMFSANRAISHTPPPSWTCYTANASQAAGNSNICYSSGSLAPGCLELYMDDFGANNTAAGHRRWILYPQTQTFGNGDVPATSGFYSANALWVFDGNYGGVRPATRDAFVAWPSPGYFPYQLVPIRWSFAYPGANFSGATVTVTKNGNPFPVSLEAVQTGYGENTVVWYDSSKISSAQPSRTAPAQDEIYQITVSGVTGVAQSSFSYTVRVFDPSVASPGQPSVTSISPTSGSGTIQSFNFLFSDPAGYANLDVINVLVNPALDGRNSCYVAFSRPSNTLYLMNDAGTALLPGMLLNGSGSTANSYCTILGAGSSATGAGTTLSLTLNVQFSQLNYAKDHVVYTAARNLTGGNSGWKTSGVWRVPTSSSQPTVASLSPAAPTGSTQTIAAVFRNPAGYSAISNAQLLINADLNASNGCYLAYLRSTNQLYLVNDANSALVGPISPNSGTGSLQNSQCTISGTGTTVSSSGTDLTLTVNLAAKAAFSGPKIVFGAFQTTTSLNTGWQARGLWTTP